MKTIEVSLCNIEHASLTDAQSTDEENDMLNLENLEVEILPLDEIVAPYHYYPKA